MTAVGPSSDCRVEVFVPRTVTVRRAASLAFMTMAVGCGSGTTSGPADPPAPTNIVYILADDLGYGDIGVYGQTRFETPSLDRLATEGMRFTQHYSGATVCAPSRAALMTGLHTGHTFIRGNKPVEPEGQYPIPDSAVTVAELLQDAGYVTGAVGKWGLGAPETEGVPNRQGFDHFFGYNCQREAHSYYPDHLWRDETRIELPENAGGGRGQYSHDLLTEDALAFIREHKDAPFFLYVPYTIPHASIDVPEDSMAPFVGRFTETAFEPGRYIGQPTPKAAFAGMVSRLAADVGRIVALIDELGLGERTLVMFSSDNGPHLEGGADPDFFDSNGEYRGYKRDLYDGGIRVPTIARWPGTVEAGAVSDHLSAFWDVLPTFVELAGGLEPSDIDGISFLPELLGEAQENHDYLYWEFHEQGGKQAVRLGNWKGVRVDLEADPNAPLELYDLAADPAERRDVASDHPEVVERIVTMMQEAHVRSDVFPFPTDRGL